MSYFIKILNEIETALHTTNFIKNKNQQESIRKTLKAIDNKHRRRITKIFNEETKMIKNETLEEQKLYKKELDYLKEVAMKYVETNKEEKQNGNKK